MDRKTAVGKARAFTRLARQVVGTSHGYLFGSYASGTAREDSDLDVGIIVRNLKGGYLEALTHLYRLRGRVDVRIEPHLVVESSDPAGFSAEIRRTGIRL
jgi:predicted nucleotidyltransferase